MATACSSDASPLAVDPIPDAEGTTTSPDVKAAQVARPELHPVLDRAPLHSEIAAHMPPGALAALEVETIINGVDAHAFATTAARVWELWEERLVTCAASDQNDGRRPIVFPAADDPFWDPVRVPRDAFRPYTEEWNRLHAFGVNDARDFFENDDPVAELEQSIDFGPCYQTTYPFDSLIPYDELVSSSTPIRDLASEATQAAREDNGLRTAWSSSLASLSGRKLLDGLADWGTCMADLGASDEVATGDFSAAIAELDRDGEVEVALMDVVCSGDIFAEVDNELLAAAINFADENEKLLLDQLDQADATETILATALAQ